MANKLFFFASLKLRVISSFHIAESKVYYNAVLMLYRNLNFHLCIDSEKAGTGVGRGMSSYSLKTEYTFERTQSLLQRTQFLPQRTKEFPYLGVTTAIYNKEDIEIQKKLQKITKYAVMWAAGCYRVHYYDTPQKLEFIRQL